MTKVEKCRGQLELDLKNIWNLTPDRWGHYKFNSTFGEFRVKLSKTSWRFEKKVGSGWVRLSGMYYTNKSSFQVLKNLLIRFHSKGI